MIDFTSSLYLGMKHSSAELKGWRQLTTGVPAALYEQELSKKVGKYVAGMQGLEDGISATSTLHLYWDLFGFLSQQPIALFIDDKVYPVSRYGIEKLSGSNIPVHPFSHLSASQLSTLIKTKLSKRAVPVVLCDGWCPQCGNSSPINDYAEIVKSYGGFVVIDDTQAFGILGRKKTKAMPYGNGGGGSLQWMNANAENIITITSLAKAFGAPMAVISGSAAFMKLFDESSVTRINSSPVSMAHLRAAENAFYINYTSGDERRAKVWKNVSLLRLELKHSGMKLQGGVFPVQSITGLGKQAAINLYKNLKNENIKTVLIKQHEQPEPALSFIVRCDHTGQDIKRLCFYLQKYNFSFSKKYPLYGNAIR